MSKELSIEQKKQINKEIDECGCNCHKPGVNCMHMAACCNSCYQKKFIIPSEEDKS